MKMKHLQLSDLLCSSSWLSSSLMLFLMLLLVNHVLQQPSGCFACVEEERIALLDIKSAFGDPYSFESWSNKSIDCCSWDGVRCSPTTKHVRRLELRMDPFYTWEKYNDNTLNVSMFLPFRELRGLSLSGNGFNSCIPSDCFGRLAKLDSTLEYLDLSWNNFDSKALSSLAALGSLKALSLRGSLMETDEFFINGSLNVQKQSQMTSELFINVSGALSKLSKLKYLDLSENWMNGSIIPYLGGISSLKTLNLGQNKMNEGLDLNVLSGALSKLSKLKYLDLSYNWMNGSIIPYLGGISSLKTLDLSLNNMNEGLDLNACQVWSNATRLENLYLYENSLNESIIPCLIGASSLKTLYLSYNNMGSSFSLEEFSKLNNLVELDLSWNKFTGVSPLISEWTSLKRLYISGNEFNGASLEGLCKIKNLEELDISYNNFKGKIPVCFGHLSSLKYIDISYNQLEMLFPSSVTKNLTMLKYALFSNNNFEGILSLDLFSNNTELKVLDLSNNYQLEVQTEHLVGMVPSFQLNEISLSNCILNKPFGIIPTFLSNQYMIEYIDVSSADLKGNFPEWLFKNKTKLNYLNLRNNSLNGPLAFPSHKTNLSFFDVSINKLTGEIPNNIGYVLPKVTHLGMAHNFLQGAIPSSFGNLSHLITLDFSNNNLSGVLPSCIRNLSSLKALSVRENKLEGNLTSEFCHSSNIVYLDLSKNNFSGLGPSCINMSYLEYLNLNGNNLKGPFPSAILGSSLIALDIGNNNFVGNIPSKIWTSLKNLKIISLKGNYFEGELSREICKLRYLRVLDISQNKLRGKIPSCLHYMGSDESLWIESSLSFYYDPPETTKLHFSVGGVTREIEYIEFSTKRRSDIYKGDILNEFSGLDLSGNQFDGKIPEKIGEMTWLQALNLSNNQLTGPIPATLSKLRDIESLDLSHNMLVGQIPPQLAELHSLEVFSVAYNNLSGPTIGLVAQFSTFDESSYEGNPYLCGPPLMKSCTPVLVPSPKGQVTNDIHDQDKEAAMDRIILFASIALGFIFGFWGWMVLLYFNRNLRYSFFLSMDGYMEEALDMVKNLLAKMKSCW